VHIVIPDMKQFESFLLVLLVAIPITEIVIEKAQEHKHPLRQAMLLGSINTIKAQFAELCNLKCQLLNFRASRGFGKTWTARWRRRFVGDTRFQTL
jgi:hypothetical protein